MIPADASVVASINLKSLASKAGLDDKENEAAKQKKNIGSTEEWNERRYFPTIGEDYEKPQ